MRQTGNTILVTGGGSGIGEAMAHRFHDLGNVVIVAGRRRDALEGAVAGRRGMHAMEVDVQDDRSVDQFAERLLGEHGDLNVLVNNAGVMRSEPLDRKRDMADAVATTETNFLGPVRMTNALIDHLVGRPDAAIVNVSSGTAFVPFLQTPTYNATKAALHSYTVALREALKGRVEVIELVAPAVQTELTPGQASRAAYMPLADFIAETMSQLAQQPTPPEILIGHVAFLRFAERDGRFQETLAQMNAFATKAGQS